jgi:hypothetical protein
MMALLVGLSFNYAQDRPLLLCSGCRPLMPCRRGGDRVHLHFPLPRFDTDGGALLSVLCLSSA